jgi:cytosine/adenosine deaminase-related metal-dependent hydrolase
VFPVCGEPIVDGAVGIEGERIVACGTSVSSSEDIRDLGNVAILPGLVNAHVHLDFSGLAAPLGQRGIRFVDWVRRVMEFRRGATAGLPSSAGNTVGQANRATQHFGSPVALGLDESLRGGVTALGDIVQPGQPLAASPIEVTALLELIAPTADRVAGAVELAKSHLSAADKNVCPTAARNVGLSPHAPYSVHPDLLAAVVELSNRHAIPVAMHLAESPEELELLRRGDGPLREFLDELGAWDATTIPHGTRPLGYLRRLADAHRALIVHGNYLDDEEIAFLGANAERMSVVYCPRTHDWFAHREYPLEKLLAAGATVALGTDGRGSSPDLSLLGEMRFAAQKHPGVPLADILRMGAIDGARALGRETEFGSLAPGRRADLAIVALPERSTVDPHELLFDPASSVVACYCRGYAAYRSGNTATS